MCDMPPTTGSKKTTAVIDNRLPTCRNYWRLSSSSNSPPQRPPPYLLKPHLIASSAVNSDSGGGDDGCNPNSKYYKLRHGIGAGQFSPLNDEIMMMNHQYRVRLPFDPSPFRGVTRFAFWLLFISILILLVVLLTALFRVEDFHDHDHELHHHLQSKDGDTGRVDDMRGVSGGSIILKALMDRYSS